MPSYSTDRRGLLKILGAIGTTCAYAAPGNELFGQTVEQQTSSPCPGRSTAAILSRARFPHHFTNCGFDYSPNVRPVPWKREFLNILTAL